MTYKHHWYSYFIFLIILFPPLIPNSINPIKILPNLLNLILLRPPSSLLLNLLILFLLFLHIIIMIHSPQRRILHHQIPKRLYKLPKTKWYIFSINNLLINRHLLFYLSLYLRIIIIFFITIRIKLFLKLLWRQWWIYFLDYLSISIIY